MGVDTSRGKGRLLYDWNSGQFWGLVPGVPICNSRVPQMCAWMPATPLQPNQHVPAVYRVYLRGADAGGSFFLQAQLNPGSALSSGSPKNTSGQVPCSTR